MTAFVINWTIYPKNRADEKYLLDFRALTGILFLCPSVKSQHLVMFASAAF
jgi:hypothetical protein